MENVSWLDHSLNCSLPKSGHETSSLSSFLSHMILWTSPPQRNRLFHPAKSTNSSHPFPRPTRLSIHLGHSFPRSTISGFFSEHGASTTLYYVWFHRMFFFVFVVGKTALLPLQKPSSIDVHLVLPKAKPCGCGFNKGYLQKSPVGEWQINKIRAPAFGLKDFDPQPCEKISSTSADEAAVKIQLRSFKLLWLLTLLGRTPSS